MKYLCKIKISKATGFDEISERFLKLFAPYLTYTNRKFIDVAKKLSTGLHLIYQNVPRKLT